MRSESLLAVSLALGLLNLVLLVRLLLRRAPADPLSGAAERAVREEGRLAREEQAAASRALREEMAAGAATLRVELSHGFKAGNEASLRSLGEIAALQQARLAEVELRLRAFGESSESGIERLRQTVDRRLADLQAGNERRLEEMRLTVDEKLHGTLERRLGESFALVSDRLEAVQRGLGEMQALAAGVGDLKRVLTNVRSRGTWGEYQLGTILEEVLTPDQFVRNYKPDDDSDDVVEFAVRLPGRGADGEPVYVPIDAKFPQEDYHRLVDAAERGDPAALQQATASLTRTVRAEAKLICDKYLRPPATTEFAIMFLPSEGLYAEVLRQPGLVQELQASCHIAVAGPTTLAAFLNSLRMGFRTVALERRSGEVWQVLGAVKVEFAKFGGVLARVQRQLKTASRTLDETGKRTRIMERRLKEVEELPDALSAGILGLPAVDPGGVDRDPIDPTVRYDGGPSTESPS